MINKKAGQKQSANIKKDDTRKITSDEFDAVMKNILSAPPQPINKDKKVKK
jgi:hypothetical protein